MSEVPLYVKGLARARGALLLTLFKEICYWFQITIRSYSRACPRSPAARYVRSTISARSTPASSPGR